MNLAFYITFGLLLGLITAFLIFNKKTNKFDLTKIIKVLSFVFVGMFFVNIFLPDLFAWRGLPEARTGILNGHSETYNFGPSEAWINAFTTNGNTRFGEIIHTLVRVGFAIGPIAIPLAICHKKPQISRVVSFIVLPFAVLNGVLFFQYIKFFTSPLAPSVFGEATRVVLQNAAFRSIWFGLLVLLEAGLSLYILLRDFSSLKITSKKDGLLFVAILLAFIFTNMPIYTAQHLFHTYTKVILTIGYPGHFVFVAAVIIEAVALYFIFRNQSKENKFILLYVMALSLIFQYSTFFKTDGVINASRWPLQLCNIAGFFILLTLITKSEKMYHFTLVVNSLGALIAIAMCDSTYNTGILYCMNIHYMVEHVNVLLTPILMGVLKVFEPLEKKDVKHVWLGFLIYWGIVLVIGTILCSFQGPKDPTGFFNGVNYLFMFNKEASTKLLGLVGPLFDIKLSIGSFNLYLVQPIVLLAFELICTAVYFGFYLWLKKKNKKY